MKKSNAILGGSLCVLIAFLIQILLREINATKFSVQISLTVILIAGVLYTMAIISNKNKMFGFKLNIISCILMLIGCFAASIETVYNDCFPQIAEAHPLLTLFIYAFEIISLFSFVIFLMIAASITAKKSER